MSKYTIAAIILFVLISFVMSEFQTLEAKGNSFMDKAPPEIEIAEWLNTSANYTLANLKGKVVVMDFWATWCGPCKRAMPHLQKLWEEFKGKGLVILAMSNENKAKVEAFITKNKYTFPVGIDTGRKTNTKYGIRSIPTTYLVHPNGKVVWEGNPLQTEALDSKIKEALKDVLADDFNEIMENLEDMQYADAIKGLKKLAKDKKSVKLAEQAKAKLAEIEKKLDEQLKKAKKDEGDNLEKSIKSYVKISNYLGLDISNQAKAELKRLKAKKKKSIDKLVKEIEKRFSGIRLFKKAQRYEKKGDLKKAIKNYKSVYLSHKKSKLGELAKKKADELKKKLDELKKKSK